MIVLSDDVHANIFSARHCSVNLTESKLNCELNPSVLLMIPPISLDDDTIHFPEHVYTLLLLNI